MSRVGSLLAAVLLLFPCTGLGADGQVTVAVDLRDLTPEAFALLDGSGLEKRVVLRLVEEGFAVVAARNAPDIVLVVTLVDDRIRVEARRSGQRWGTEVARGSGSSRAELHLEVAQKAAELSRTARAQQSTGNPPPPAASRARRLESTVGLDVLVRQGGVDPLVRLAGRVAVVRGLGLHLVTGIAPSVGTIVSVIEWQLLTGAGYHFMLGRLVGLESSVLVGLLLHHYAYSTPGEGAGTRFGPLVSLPLLVTLFPHPRVGIEFRIAPGVTSEGRVVLLGAQEVWARGAFRLEAGAGLTWRW